MPCITIKGEARKKKDLQRLQKGVNTEMKKRDSTPHCHYEESTKAVRKKGRQRFKTGKKSGKSG